ncbi:hypothetical protein N476_03605 [Pseudoalteromonas luteoviolacea H33]|uniref:Uncharacterized protein n=1 Tax=Pseudoalteromonas luteoviolacea H33 TaxID=1365251 RepID=A0A167B7E3_9GAMM|nr:hypothetical protein N476_03605 [Pseudoalteromonas luteoviolacea H33]
MLLTNLTKTGILKSVNSAKNALKNLEENIFTLKI